MSQTYSDVDGSADPVEAAAWQERMASWPAIRAYKERTYELIAGSGRVIDIGCGPGVDVVVLGQQRARLRLSGDVPRRRRRQALRIHAHA